VNYNPNYTDEKTQAQRGNITFFESHTSAKCSVGPITSNFQMVRAQHSSSVKTVCWRQTSAWSYSWDDLWLEGKVSLKPGFSV
jgi:hypothetical protein